ncbi:hypothetical protein GCM10027059_50360 [Myceligenerans halotolerans]
MNPNPLDLGAANWIALGAVLVALVAQGVSAWNTSRALAAQREALATQRQMAADDRIWEKRAEAYERLLTWANRNLRSVKETVDDSSSGVEMLDRLRNEYDARQEMPIEIEVPVLAYGSSQVRELLYGMRDVHGIRARSLNDLDADGMTTAGSAELTIYAVLVAKISEELREGLR